MSDKSRLNLTLLPAEVFALIAQNYSLETLIELAKNSNASNEQEPMVFSDGKPLGLDSKALAQKLRLQPNEKELIRTGALQVLQEHLQVLIQNNVRLMGKPGHDEPHLILEQTLQEQRREINELLRVFNYALMNIDLSGSLSIDQRLEATQIIEEYITKLNAAVTIQGTYVGNIIETDVLLNEMNMTLIQSDLDEYELKPKRRLSFTASGLTRLPEDLITKLQGYPRLTTLYLDRNELTTLPESFGNLVALTELMMNNNRLITLPESFGNLVALLDLWMDNNQLTTLPESFGNLVMLSGLMISNNRLITLPESFGNLVALIDLWMNNNQLATFPESFGNLVMLSGLMMDNNPLTTLPNCFGNLMALNLLLMQNNAFISLPESIRQVLIKTDNQDLLPLLAPMPIQMDESSESDDDDISPAATYTPSAASLKKQGQKRKAEKKTPCPEDSIATCTRAATKRQKK